MGRLTKHCKSNVSPLVLKMLDIEDVLTECIEIIKTDGDTCSSVCEEHECECSDCPINEAVKKLAHYEDLEEQGRLIVTPETGIGDLSDGYHTFNELYHHRAVLFSVICNAFKSCAWKSKMHSDGTMYDGMFIVGIDTPEGSATYHYDIEPYWNMFDVKELDKAPEWDGHTPEDAISRIAGLSKSNRLIEQKHGTWESLDSYVYEGDGMWQCSECGEDFYFEFGTPLECRAYYCPNCGAKMGVE